MKTEIFEIKTGNSEQTIGNLKKSLKEAKSELLNAAQGSEEFARALDKAAQAEQTLRDLNETVTRQSKGLEGAMSGLATGLSGVAGATNAVLGTMSLLGVENEELNKKLNQSITSLIGITQGLQSIDPAIKGFKDLSGVITHAAGATNKFKLALIGTGLGALVVVLGSIIANWDEFSQTIGISSDTMEKFGDITKRTIRAAGTVIKNFTQGITQSVAGIINAFKKVFKGDFKGAFDELKGGLKNAGKEFKEMFTETASEWSTELPKKVETGNKKVVTNVKQTTTEIKDEVTNLMNKLLGTITESEAKKVSDWLNMMFQDENGNPLIEKQIEFLAQFKNNWAGLVQYINENPIKIDQLKNLRTELQNALPTDDQIVRKWLDQAFVDENGKPLLEAQIQFLNAWTGSYEDLVAYVKNNPVVFKVTVPKEAKVDKIMDGIVGAIEDAQWKITRGFYVTTGSIRNTADALMSLTSIMDKSSDTYKAFYISSVIMSTAAGIAETWFAVMKDESLPMMWMKIATGATTTAALLANGIAQIANIKKDTLSNQANVGGSSAIPDVSTTAIQESNWRGGEYQVYVTETDITSTQNKVRVIEANSRF